MNVQVSLSEQELKDAVRAYLREQGHVASSVAFNYTPGDRPCDIGYFSATAFINNKTEPAP